MSLQSNEFWGNWRSDAIDQLRDQLKGLRLAIFQALLLRQPPEPLLEVSFSKSRSVKTAVADFFPARHSQFFQNDFKLKVRT